MSEIDLRLDEIFHLCASKGAGRCPVRCCRRSSRKDGKLCGTHHVAAWRKRNPTKAAWRALQDHARARKLEFSIPFEAFKELCERTGYVEHKGNKPENLAIDRIKNWLGYTLDNIRVVTVEINGRKGYYEKALKLSTGQQVLWEQIGIDEHIRQSKSRKDAYVADKINNHNQSAGDDEEPLEDEVPAWLRPREEQAANSDDPF